MKWVLIVWWMVGPVDGALEDMTTRHFQQEYATQDKCYEALFETSVKVAEIENLRGAVIECRPDDSTTSGI